MTTCRCSEEGPECAEQAALGVLFVHGIGSAVQGGTLRAHSEPLVDWLANGTEQFGRAELLNVALTPGDNEPAHLTCQLFKLKDREKRDESKPVTTWILAESHWAQTFKPASYIRIATWLIGAVPWMLGEYVHGALRRERTRKTARVLWLRWVLVPFYALLGTILAGPIVVLLVLLLPAQYAPVKSIREWSSKLPRALSASLGDVYIILATHVDREAIRARIVRDHEWLKSRCVETVVVAHSAGSALTHQLIRDGRIEGVKVYVTLGEAIWRMQWMKTLSRTSARRMIALGLAVLGFALLVAGVVMFIEQGPLWATIGLLLLGGIVHALSAWSVWHRTDADEARRNAKDELCCTDPPKVSLWRDYIASSDPVPGGALTDTPHATKLSGAVSAPTLPGAVGYQPVWIRNKRSMVLDHVAYPDNLEEYVAGLGADLVRGDTSLKTLPPLIGADTARRAQIARGLRTLSMSMVRLSSAAVALAMLMVLTRDHGSGLQRLGARVGWAADALTDAAGKILGADTLKPKLAGELAGLAITIIVLAAAYLVISGGWKAWDRKDRRLFMGRKNPVDVTATTAIKDLPAVVGSRAIDAKFAGWWLLWWVGASTLLLVLAEQTARWWLPLPALFAGTLLILFVRIIARWRDRAYGLSTESPQS
jgi:hypothetical protein